MTQDDKLKQLRAVPLFAGLKDKELKDVLGRARARSSIRKGRALNRQLPLGLCAVVRDAEARSAR